METAGTLASQKDNLGLGSNHAVPSANTNGQLNYDSEFPPNEQQFTSILCDHIVGSKGLLFADSSFDPSWKKLLENYPKLEVKLDQTLCSNPSWKSSCRNG